MNVRSMMRRKHDRSATLEKQGAEIALGDLHRIEGVRELWKAGMRLFRLSGCAWAGHLSQHMTELYTHISQRSMEEAAERYQQGKAELLAEAQAKLASKEPLQPRSKQVN